MNTLNIEEIKRIHTSSLRILEEIGMVVKHEGARDILKTGGATVEGETVFISPAMVDKALFSAPSSVTLYDRKGSPAIILEGRNVYFGPGSDTMHRIEFKTRQKKVWLTEDVKQGIKLCDNLAHIDFVMSLGIISDVEREMNTRRQYAVMLRNTTKPQVVVCDNGKDFRDIIDMAAAVRGSLQTLANKPLFMLYAEPTSPLVNTKDALDKLLLAAELRIPTNYAQGGMAGATTPLSAAGTITLGNAECLFGLVLHQLKNKGAPFIYGFGNAPLDMKSAQSAYAVPLAIQIQGGMCDMGHYYNLPIWGEGGNSCSKLPDQQAAVEASQFILMAYQQGCNLVHDVGYLDFGLGFSFEQLVCCNEIIERTKSTMAPFPVNEEAIALDEIKKIGAGGNFLKSKQTFMNMKKIWRGDLSDFQGYDDWMRSGAKTMAERASERVASILANHAPEPLDPDTDKKVEDILIKASQRISQKD